MICISSHEGPLQTQPPSQGALELGGLVRIIPSRAPNGCNFVPPASFSHRVREDVTWEELSEAEAILRGGQWKTAC